MAKLCNSASYILLIRDREADRRDEGREGSWSTREAGREKEREMERDRYVLEEERTREIKCVCRANCKSY